MKSKILIISIFLIIIISSICAFINAGRWLVKEDNITKADAMVILMGRISDRVLQAADLYNQNVAGKVLIVGPGLDENKDLEARGVYIESNSTQARKALVSMGLPFDSILILPGYEARSTLTEAKTIRDYLIKNPGIDTLLLVTSAQHTRRAYMIFKSAFRNSERHVEIFCSPSIYTKFTAERWWETNQDMRVVLLEYLKMANFLLIDRWRLKNHEVCLDPVDGCLY